VIYGFRSGMWASVDATYFTGGRTTLNARDEQRPAAELARRGDLAVPVNRENSIKLYAAAACRRARQQLRLIGVAWQYRWGGGL
jgi:hypothetical protein